MSLTVTHTDLLSPDAYGLVRPAYRGRIIELKGRRRAMIGPHISVVFESRETVLYQLQEILWIERPLSLARIAEEIAEYERLIPRSFELTATLMLHGGPPEAGRILMESLVSGRNTISLKLDGRAIAAEALSPRGDDSCPVQYIRFSIDHEAIDVIVSQRVEALLVAHYGDELINTPLSGTLMDELASILKASRGPGARANRRLSLRAAP